MSDLLSQASLVLIPSGYKEDVVYSVVPTDGSGDLSFTRASNGTRINSAGLVEVTPWNLLEQSETFDNAYWTKNRSSISANSTTAPNGTATADSLIEDTANGTHEFIRVLAVDLQTYNLSIYAKANTRTKIQLVLAGSPWATGGNGEASFDLTLGTVISAVNGATGTIESVGNGWYKCTISKITSAADPSGVIAVRLLDASGNASYTGNGTSGAYYWGAQLNIGATAKPYFPTTDRLNVPRLTYQNGGGGCPSLLLEKQSTNLALYSEDFSNAAWIKFNATITANDAISPDGTQNADKVVFAGSNHYIYQQTSFVGQATASIYVKGTAGQTISIDNTQVITEPLITLTGEWQRVILTSTTSGAAVQGLAISTFQSATARTIYVWGGQIEQSSYPTSYIPTTSASATRVADACSKTSATALIGQTEGVLFTDFVCNGFQDFGTPLCVNDGSTSNSIWLTTFANGTLRGEVFGSGSVQASFSMSGGVVGQRYKMALAYKANDFAMYVNGVQIGTDLVGSIPSNLNRVDYDYANAAVYSLSLLQINQSALFKTRLSNSELIALTTL